MKKYSAPKTRIELFKELFPQEPAFRIKQLNEFLFKPAYTQWNECTSLSKNIREILSQKIPWISITKHKVFQSNKKDTFKALLKTSDGLIFESVLMKNKRDYWTICVSSQVGCAMGCTFCATGAMGLKRSLNSDEISDQMRFWMYFLQENPQLNQRISNVVFMGMGEPLANYENVKQTIQIWLTYTDIGKTKITVSTVGVLPTLNKILRDLEWPDVRIAISLHSADESKRKEIVPTTVPGFHEKLAQWSHQYHEEYGNRRHHITYEYTLLNNVNDSHEHAEKLVRFIKKTGVSKINVIPYNPVKGKPYIRGQQERIDQFKKWIRDYDITITQRKTMGDDIDAACGQLATK